MFTTKPQVDLLDTHNLLSITINQDVTSIYVPYDSFNLELDEEEVAQMIHAAQYAAALHSYTHAPRYTAALSPAATPLPRDTAAYQSLSTTAPAASVQAAVQAAAASPIDTAAGTQAAAAAPIELLDMGQEELDTGSKRKKRVYLKDPEDQALLVRTCVNHFEEYVRGPREEYWSNMRAIFCEATGIDLVVQGMMKNYEKDRRERVKQDKGKSGVARSETDKDQALDVWIELKDSLEIEKSRKKKSEDESCREREIVNNVREDMCNVFGKKRGAPSDMEEPEKANKRQVVREILPKGNAKVVDNIIAMNQEGDRELLNSIKDIEKEKMENFNSNFRLLLESRSGGSGSEQAAIRAEVADLRSHFKSEILDMREEARKNQGEMMQFLRDNLRRASDA
ncbi:uncharacterized protein H6S33_011753 [Morchella sextelata]|uniref:uncharacterized protein n=1 Tax=Morchella sextelata TaxID=1174677 RepID=UPI001D057B0F|nr:uncharacterized protein H6S33_011753 [Morchella sextelata]KAH0610226.1 hypothetical protein H6S33_011753 [Morchella sextelata]